MHTRYDSDAHTSVTAMATDSDVTVLMVIDSSVTALSVGHRCHSDVHTIMIRQFLKFEYHI